jgi:hypothetical protein
MKKRFFLIGWIVILFVPGAVPSGVPRRELPYFFP